MVPTRSVIEAPPHRDLRLQALAIRLTCDPRLTLASGAPVVVAQGAQCLVCVLAELGGQGRPCQGLC